jgi:hypothetical protein
MATAKNNRLPSINAKTNARAAPKKAPAKKAQPATQSKVSAEAKLPRPATKPAKPAARPKSKLDAKPKAKQRAKAAGKRTILDKLTSLAVSAGAHKQRFGGKEPAAAAPAVAKPAQTPSLNNPQQPIFDRLTDSRLYADAQKQRSDSQPGRSGVSAATPTAAEASRVTRAIVPAERKQGSIATGSAVLRKGRSEWKVWSR